MFHVLTLRRCYCAGPPLPSLSRTCRRSRLLCSSSVPLLHCRSATDSPASQPSQPSWLGSELILDRILLSIRISLDRILLSIRISLDRILLRIRISLDRILLRIRISLDRILLSTRLSLGSSTLR